MKSWCGLDSDDGKRDETGRVNRPETWQVALGSIFVAELIGFAQ